MDYWLPGTERLGEIDCQYHEGTPWVDVNVMCLDWGEGLMGIFICQLIESMGMFYCM